jgi:hypothetical protein
LGPDCDAAFHVTGKHTKAATSITKQEGVQRVVAQSPISSVFGRASVKMDGVVPESTHDLENGEKVIPAPGEHNMEAVFGTNGLEALVGICSAVDPKKIVPV